MTRLFSTLMVSVSLLMSGAALAASHGGAMKDDKKKDELKAACMKADAKMDDKMKADCKAMMDKK